MEAGTAETGTAEAGTAEAGTVADGGSGFRIEHDSMGEVQVPADALWAAQTQRAVQNFPISGERLSRDLIWALASIKGAGAMVNAELGVLDAGMAGAIHDAAAEVARGDHDDQFPVDVFQTGSGTSSNMNANEVIAALASRRLGRAVHPNDHVNASQSSNDVFPSAIHLAASRLIRKSLLAGLDHLAAALEAKAAEFADVVKSGRTHLMDATPVTLGQEFGGYAAAVRHGAQRATAVLPDIGELPLGGTAVGTGLNAPAGFAAAVIARLATDLDLPLTEARNHFEAAGARDALVATSGVMRTIAVSEFKICNDLRLMGSGPRTGLAEIAIPDLQPGSSIMPGKVNPVIPEVVLQVAAQVIGNDTAITIGGMQGNLELNVRMPLIARNLLSSITLLSSAATVLDQKCVSGIEANLAGCERSAEATLSAATALNPHIGYDAATKIVQEAVRSGRPLREVAREQGVSEEVLDEALDLRKMALGS